MRYFHSPSPIVHCCHTLCTPVKPPFVPPPSPKKKAAAAPSKHRNGFLPDIFSRRCYAEKLHRCYAENSV